MKDNVIFLFPGQGAQYSGMCRDIYREYAVVRHVFELISDYAHQNIQDMCFSCTNTDLMRPDRASLTTLAHSVSVIEIIKDYFKSDLNMIAGYAAGHSMGQYSALYAVESMSLPDTVRVLKERSAQAMNVGGNNGGMICIVGLSKPLVDDLIDSVSGQGFAAVANYNLHNQFVISGENIALDALLERAKVAGAKIAKRLSVSIPAHCKLMKPLQSSMRKCLESVPIKTPKMTLFSNETGDVISNPQHIKDSLANQMCNGVNWVGIMDKFPSHNIVHAYELGPGKVLSGLVNRANVNCVAQYTNNLENVRAVCRQLECIIAQR